MKNWKNPFKHNYLMLVKILLLLLTVIVIMLLLPRERRYKYDYRLGKPWVYSDLIAPFDFPILKPDVIVNQERNRILEQKKFYFKYDSTAIENGLLEMKSDFTSIQKIIGQHSNYYFRRWSSIYVTIMQHGVIERISEFENATDDDLVMVMNGVVATECFLNSFYSIQQASQQIEEMLDPNNEMDMKFGKRFLEEHLKQNIIFDEDLTSKMLNQQLDLISTTSGAVQTGEIIITRGELVTEEKALILDSFKKSFLEMFGSSSNTMRIFWGQLIIILLIISALAFYLYFFNKSVFNDNRQLMMILTIVMLMQFIVFIIYYIFGNQYLYIVPFCLAVVLITVFFDARTAIFVHIVVLINSSMIMVNGFEFLFVQLAAGIVAAFTLRKMHKRAQMFFMIFMVFITYVLTDVGLTFIEENEIASSYDSLIYYGLSSGFLVFGYPLIFVFEKIFGTITDISLIEISDTNSYLLRELSVKAPGTFQHSNQVANLAEEAAYVINANPLLVRAGAWYHDVGKIENPLYFIENQTSDINPHDELSPDESAEIIINHVIKGIELARKHYIPESVIDFIRTHHGTRKTAYFYHQMQLQNPGKKIDADAFTYHGQIPFSKETALLMMADSVEAASRSLPEKTEETISDLIDRIIEGQMKDHQFDKADITMNDITNIKKVFQKLLINIYHVRISY
ncbi:MAG: HDIG domain-containing protein [Bacteroidales bacterium]|nr:HDIG domain-containing protein [Bacteroidales bacterium]